MVYTVNGLHFVLSDRDDFKHESAETESTHLALEVVSLFAAFGELPGSVELYR